MGSISGIGALYLVPLIVGPLIAALTGWQTARLQSKGQVASAVGVERTALTSDLRQEVVRLHEEMEDLRKQLRTVRDVLVRMLQPAQLVTPQEVKDQLLVLIREGLKEL